MEDLHPRIALEGNPKVKTFTDPSRMNAQVLTRSTARSPAFQGGGRRAPQGEP